MAEAEAEDEFETSTTSVVPMAISRAKTETENLAEPSPSSSSASSSSTESPVVLKDYKQAMEYLKRLDEFALMKEDFRLIGLIGRLMELFKANDEHGEPEVENVPLEIESSDHETDDPEPIEIDDSD